MGAVSLLVTHARYQFGPTNQAYPGLGGHNRGPRILHIGRGAATKCARSVPSTAGTAMAMNGLYQTKLAKEYPHLLAWEDEGTGEKDRMIEGPVVTCPTG